MLVSFLDKGQSVNGRVRPTTQNIRFLVYLRGICQHSLLHNPGKTAGHGLLTASDHGTVEATQHFKATN